MSQIDLTAKIRALRWVLPFGCLAMGCGLISSDVATISFDLPPKHYVFDTGTLNLPAGTLPSVPCTPGSDTCCALAGLAGYDCTKNPPLTCDDASSTCAISVTTETPPQTIDLHKEVPQLSSINSQSLANISISQIAYNVVSSLNADLPPVELFLAPADAADTSDPRAHKFGTLPVIPANASVTGGKVTLEADAESTFSGYARNFGTPFRFLSRTKITVAGGSSTPTGAVDITITGRIKAKPNL